MKKLYAGFFALVLLTMWCVTTTQARPRKRLDKATGMCRFLSQGQLDYDSEPWGRGVQKFREVCKRCHSKDGGAKFLHAESYMPEAWNSIFYKRRKPCARNGSWDELSQEDLLLVNDYLYRNGDWTYDPNDADSCG